MYLPVVGSRRSLEALEPCPRIPVVRYCAVPQDAQCFPSPSMPRTRDSLRSANEPLAWYSPYSRDIGLVWPVDKGRKVSPLPTRLRCGRACFGSSAAPSELSPSRRAALRTVFPSSKPSSRPPRRPLPGRPSEHGNLPTDLPIKLRKKATFHWTFRRSAWTW